MLTPSVAGQRYVPGAVNYDGTNDYLTRGAGLTGAADGKQMTFACWFRSQQDTTAVGRLLTSNTSVGGAAATQSMRIQKRTTNDLQVVANNAAGTIILNVNSTANSVEIADGWQCLTFSCDLTDTAKRHLFIGNTADLALISTYTNDTIDFTLADWGVGGNPDGSNKLTADVVDLMFWPSYIDLSVTANRRLFISNASKPVNPGSAIRALGTPLIRLSGPLAAWHTNKGSGGGFTMTGALTTAATNPSS